MGCISSKLLASADFGEDLLFTEAAFRPSAGGDFPNHVVSLTSTTYGVLSLDRDAAANKEEEKDEEQERPQQEEEIKRECKRSPPPSLTIHQSTKKMAEPSEVINAWELMEDLADETPIWSPLKKPSKPSLLKHFSPSAVARALASPKRHHQQQQKKKSNGKENTPLRHQLQQDAKRSDLGGGSSNRVLRPFSSLDNTQWLGLYYSIPKKSTPVGAGIRSFERDSPAGGSSSRRSLSPFFDPELLATLEKEHCEQGEQIKKVVTSVPSSCKPCDSSFLLLQSYEEKCPPGGKSTVVLYTTTLKGIRKTFEDCNAVRSTIEAYDVQVAERDISMDSGYREELRLLMGKKEVKIPVVFVKGRLIGGAEEVLKLEEEGKLGLVLDGIARAARRCEGCGGVRFVMCMNCNGSRKVMDEQQKKPVRCGECNENGLIHCPLCC